MPRLFTAVRFAVVVSVFPGLLLFSAGMLVIDGLDWIESKLT